MCSRSSWGPTRVHGPWGGQFSEVFSPRRLLDRCGLGRVKLGWDGTRMEPWSIEDVNSDSTQTTLSSYWVNNFTGMIWIYFQKIWIEMCLLHQINNFVFILNLCQSHGNRYWCAGWRHFHSIKNKSHFEKFLSTLEFLICKYLVFNVTIPQWIQKSIFASLLLINRFLR